VQYIGATVIYTTHPKIHLDEKYHVVNLRSMIDQGEDVYVVMCWLDANQYLNIQDY